MKRLFALLFMAGLGGAVLPAAAQPVFLFEPLSVSASPGAPILFQGIAIGPGPVEYQWYKNGEAILGQQTDFIFFPGVVAEDAGEYWVVATAFSLSATSSVATLSLDTTFTKIAVGSLVNSPSFAVAAAWNDYDADGFPDVFIARAGVAPNELYRNLGDGTFALQMGSGLGELADSQNAAWSDFDNDGWLDLLVVNSGTSSSLYRNNGNGTFSRTNAGPISADVGGSTTAAWGDYNRDGWLDVFIGTSFGLDFLYSNKGDGSFARITNAATTDTFSLTASAVWGDADNDGDLDLLLGSQGIGGFLRGDERLFLIDQGSFSALEGDPLVTSGGTAVSCAWVDVDNDMDLDVFVANAGQDNALFLNDGSGHFTAAQAGDLTNSAEAGGQARACAWDDYDNDGWVDVFVSNVFGDNFLYRNDGDGTFTRVLTGSPVNDRGTSAAAAWVDYDRDGFVDLHVANAGEAGFLYRNNGNANAWISVRCRALANNRFAVGAKVKVLATIGGTPRWQMREIGARDGLGSPATLEAHFGLGDAAQIDILRVEWPSGLVQEIPGVQVNQFLIVGEPALFPAPTAALEGDVGSRALQVPVLLGHPTNGMVAVDFYTRAGTALAGVDFAGTNGTLVFQPGQTSNWVEVQILGDLADEPDEFFFVVLTNATGSALSMVEARATILDDDPVVVAVNDIETLEGDSGTTDAVFNIFLSKPSMEVVSATYRLSDFSGVAGVDYITQPPGVVVFQPGETSKPVAVQVIGDVINEPLRGFGLRLLQATNASPNRRTALCNIIDNDPLPALHLHDGVVWEGPGATASVQLEVIGLFSRNITVRYSTSPNTAIPGGDYQLTTSQLTLVPGTTNRTITVPVQNDGIAELAETFFVVLDNVSNAVLARDQAVVRVFDDDIQLLDPRQVPAGFRFGFLAMRGVRYRVEWSAELDGEWMALSGYEEVVGTGGVIQIVDPAISGIDRRFYRIELLP